MTEENIEICNGCKFIEISLFVMDEGCYPQCYHPIFGGNCKDITGANNPIGKDEKFPRPYWCPLKRS
jgi:hypothetical protein